MKKQDLTKGQAKFSVVLGTFFSIIGLVCCGYSVYVMWKVHNAKLDWSRVDGTITHSGWRHEQDRAGSLYTSSFHDVRYEYNVDGKKYTSTKVGIWGTGGSGPGANKAREIIRRYNEGDQVVVYVNPRNHADAMLDPDCIPWYWLLFPGALGVLFLFGGIRQAAQAIPLAMGGPDKK